MAVFIACIVVLVIFYVCWSLARITSRLFRLELTIPESFLVLLAILHIAAAPLLLMHGPYAVYKFIFLALVISIGAYGLPLLWRQYRAATPLIPFAKKYLRDWTFVLLIGGGIIVLILSQLFVRYNFDDSFNVSLIHQSINNPRLYLGDNSTGDPAFFFQPFYRLQSWELFLSVLADVSNLSANTIAHTVIPTALIVIAYSAYRRLFGLLTRTAKNSNLATFFLLVIDVCGTYSRFPSSLFLLGGSWRGKSVIATLLLPILARRLIEYYQKPTLRHAFLLAVFGITGASLNPAAIYLLGIPYGIVGLALLRNRKLKPALWLAASLLPLALHALFLRANIQQFADTWVPFRDAPIFSKDWWPIFSSFYGKKYWYLLVVCGLTAWLITTKKAMYRPIKQLIWYSLVLLLIPLNPIVTHLISEQLTSPITYWRLYWLLPVSVLASAGLSLLVAQKQRLGWAMFAVIILLLQPAQGFMFQPRHGFSKSLNLDKIPASVSEVAEYIDQRGGGTVLGEEVFSIYGRTVSNKITLVWSRELYLMGYLDVASAEYGQRATLFAFANGSQTAPPDAARVTENLEKYRIEWLVVKTDRRSSVENVLRLQDYHVIGDYLVVRL